jgi:hypothetical protein
MTDSEQETTAIVNECARDYAPGSDAEWIIALARMVLEARAMVPRQVVVFEDRDCGFACYVDRAD